LVAHIELNNIDATGKALNISRGSSLPFALVGGVYRFNSVGGKSPSFRVGMKADTLIFCFVHTYSSLGMGQAEFTPVETSVTRLPDVTRRNVSVDGKLRSGVDGDRVWSWKQEATSFRGW